MSKNEFVNTGDNLSFASLGIKESILNVISDLGLSIPTPIQHQAIPAALSGGDIVGIAQTGTGKTFAFGIPMLQRLALVKGRGLVLLPTRELAGQVENSLRSLGGPLGLRTVSLIGGEAISRQLMALRRRPHIIVATPGRLIDHLKRGSVKLDDISVLVLDEADMMFDMGFAPQIDEVLRRVPENRQTLLFSATMPTAVMKLAAKHLRTPLRVEVAPAGTTAELVEQEIYILSRDSRWDQLLVLLGTYKNSVLIFVRTKHGASKLTKKLKSEGFKAAEIHSNLSFSQRQSSLAGFRSGLHRILVATDVAARGLDINDIELVLNFDLPDNSEDYVHRIGRTARAGKKGKAISFASPEQRAEIQKIERLIRQSLPVKNIKSSGYNSRPYEAARPSSQKNFSKAAAPKVVKKFTQAPKMRDNRPNFEQTTNNSSLGFRRRLTEIDVTAVPDYLKPNNKKATGFVNRSVNPNNGRRNARVANLDPVKPITEPVPTAAKRSNQRTFTNTPPPIVDPSFGGGNRFAFRRTMYLLKEEAKGRPVSHRPRVSSPKSPISQPTSSLAKPSIAPTVKATPIVDSNRFRQRQVGVRASGFKIFKSGEGSKTSGSAASSRPSFTSRFKKK